QRRALACRLTDDHLLLLDAGTGAALGERLAGLPGAEGLVQADATSAYAGFWLIGPHTGEVLRRLTHLDTSPAALPPGSCAEAGLAGVPASLVAPPARSLPSVRVYVSWDLGEYVWEQLWEAGAPWAITPLGLQALQALLAAEAGHSL